MELEDRFRQVCAGRKVLCQLSYRPCGPAGLEPATSPSKLVTDRRRPKASFRRRSRTCATTLASRTACQPNRRSKQVVAGRDVRRSIQLSYEPCGSAGLEPATSKVTDRRRPGAIFRRRSRTCETTLASRKRRRARVRGWGVLLAKVTQLLRPARDQSI